MDKEFLLRVEKTLKSIKRDLLYNENIRKLLYYESADLVDSARVPEIELVKDNIFLQPITEIDNNPPFNKKMFISITCPTGGLIDDVTMDYAFKISVMVDKTDWVYGDNSIRVYSLCQEVVNTINGKKYDLANALDFEQVIEVVLDKTIQGKSLLFSNADGVGDM